MVERCAVNARVAGSSPAFPAKWKRPTTGGGAVLKTAGRKVWGFESLRFRYIEAWPSGLRQHFAKVP